jgi:hypothetical protein
VKAQRRLAALVLVAGATLAPVGAGADSSAPGLAGGEAVGRGLFVTYTDQDTVIEGGTVAPPDFSAPVARAAIDLTGLGAALASLAYSPYSDAAGVINAFGGTSLPVGSLFEPSRAKVAGRPPQEQASASPGPPGSGVRARLADGPVAEAITLAAGPAGPGFAVRIGDLRSVVRQEGTTAGSTVSVVLRAVSIGDVLTFDSIILTASAVADGGPGQATANALVEGVSLAGKPVRLTPQGLEPAGAGAPDLAALTAAGIEILGAGESVATPGGRQADARSTGPRLRLRSVDGRMLTLVLGQAMASSSFVPPSGS